MSKSTSMAKRLAMVLAALLVAAVASMGIAWAETATHTGDSEDSHFQLDGQVLLQDKDKDYPSGETYREGIYSGLANETALVHLLQVKTDAQSESGKTIKAAAGQSITDFVSISGLTAGKRYTLRGMLVDKDTGDEITSYEMRVDQFTASSDTIERQVLYRNIDASKLAGKKYCGFCRAL